LFVQQNGCSGKHFEPFAGNGDPIPFTSTGLGAADRAEGL
jgi:hypothetical protein